LKTWHLPFAEGFYSLIPYRFFAILIGLEKNEINPKEMIVKIKGLFFLLISALLFMQRSG